MWGVPDSPTAGIPGDGTAVGLAGLSKQIADALRQQSQQNPEAVAGQGAGSPNQDSNGSSQEMASRFAQAADRVDDAAQSMEQAVHGLGGEPVHLQVAQDHQASAIEELERALKLLAPPEQEDSDSQQEQPQQAGGQQNQGDGQQDQSRAQSGHSGEADKQSKEQASQQFDAERLLQAVRDRQAQRQRQRNQRGAAGYVPVDKDW